MHAEWTLLNDPQRLQTLADQFLALKTVAPGQFTNMAELDNRLPAVQAPPAAPPPDPEPVPVAQGPDAVPVEQPKPAALRRATRAKPPGDHRRPPPQPTGAGSQTGRGCTDTAAARRRNASRRRGHPRLSQKQRHCDRHLWSRSARPPPAAPRPIVAAEVSRPVVVPARVDFAAASVLGRAVPGSSLGMARSTSVAAPQPLPAPRRGPALRAAVAER